MYDDSTGNVPVDMAIKKTKPGKDPDFDAAMKMLGHLRYTWARILDTVPGCGLKCQDLLTDEKFFLFERNMSTFSSLKEGAIAGGIVPVGNCFMHTGFGIPMPSPQRGDDTFEDMVEELLTSLGISLKRPVRLSKGQTASLAAVSIRALLLAGITDGLKLSFD